MMALGYIDGIDLIAIHGCPVRCLAFVNKKLGGSIYVQVQTDMPEIQTVLQFASLKGAKVEVYYTKDGMENIITRVHIKDRK